MKNASPFHYPKVLMAVLLSSTAGAGRGDSGIPQVTQAGDDPDIGIKYKKDKGLFVTPISAKIIGLQMTEVLEQPFEKTVTFQAQVYDDAAKDKALASGWVPAEQAEFFKRGQTLVIAGGGSATVTEVSTFTTAANKRAEVLIEIADDADALRIGEFVTASLTVKSENDVVVVPASAVFRTSEGMFAYAENGGWKFRTPVTTGAEKDGLVEVTDGLFSGDSVVSAPVMTLWLTELQLTKSGKA